MIVDCEFQKWGDRPHWRFPARMLERDDYGTWLGALPPTPYTGPRGAGEWEYAFVILVPVADWWVASFNDERQPDVAVYVDICTPAEWHTLHHVTAIDLDLDVIRLRDGRVVLDDEDEFIEHRTKYGYPEEVIARATETAERLMQLVADRIEPFGDAGADRLAQLLDDPHDP